MAVKMYKDKNSKMVRGMNVQAHLDTGWTFEPVKTTKAKLKPKRMLKATLKVGEVKVINEDLSGPEDLTTEETTNGD